MKEIKRFHPGKGYRLCLDWNDQGTRPRILIRFTSPKSPQRDAPGHRWITSREWKLAELSGSKVEHKDPEYLAM